MNMPWPLKHLNCYPQGIILPTGQLLTSRNNPTNWPGFYLQVYISPLLGKIFRLDYWEMHLLNFFFRLTWTDHWFLHAEKSPNKLANKTPKWKVFTAQWKVFLRKKFPSTLSPAWRSLVVILTFKTKKSRCAGTWIYHKNCSFQFQWFPWWYPLFQFLDSNRFYWRSI